MHHVHRWRTILLLLIACVGSIPGSAHTMLPTAKVTLGDSYLIYSMNGLGFPHCSLTYNDSVSYSGLCWFDRQRGSFSSEIREKFAWPAFCINEQVMAGKIVSTEKTTTPKDDMPLICIDATGKVRYIIAPKQGDLHSITGTGTVIIREWNKYRSCLLSPDGTLNYGPSIGESKYYFALRAC